MARAERYISMSKSILQSYSMSELPSAAASMRRRTDSEHDNVEADVYVICNESFGNKSFMIQADKIELQKGLCYS